MKNIEIQQSENILSKASEKYAEQIALRAMAQAIPYVGGAIDTLLGGHGSKIQEKRLRHYLDIITHRLEKLEASGEIQPSEELFDFLIKSFDSVIKTRSAIKREQFAEIFSKQITQQNKWEEAETVTRLLNELSDIHIFILNEAISTSTCSAPFENLRVITFNAKSFGEDSDHPPKIITQALPSYSELALKMGCSELMSKGLLYDEGIGRWDTKAMEYLVPTELADWLISWIKKE